VRGEQVDGEAAVGAQLRQRAAQPLARGLDQRARLAGLARAALLDERRQLLVVVAHVAALGVQRPHEGCIPRRAAEEVGPDGAELALDRAHAARARHVGVDVVADEQHAPARGRRAVGDAGGECGERRRLVAGVERSRKEGAERVEPLGLYVVAVEPRGEPARAPAHTSSSA
jgi:hypothetical protein